MATARELLGILLDAGSFRSWDVPLADPPAADQGYRDRLAEARRRTGVDEAVLTGQGLVRGWPVAVAVCEFGFLGGSIGVAAAERLVAAVERAGADGLPLLAAPSSGGTRMQEGAVAFLQMVKVTSAITRHVRRGLPYLVYLRHPTTGGVFASWGSLGHVTVAEPGALIGFLGPRVYAELRGAPFPAGVQTAENLLAHGLVDAVVPAVDLPAYLARALEVLTAPHRALPGPPPAEPAWPGLSRAGRPAPLAVAPAPAWESVERSRRVDRPGVRALLGLAGDQVTSLCGTGAGESGLGLILALAAFGAAPCVLAGHDRTAAAPFGPAGLRAVRRGIRLAGELGLPMVSVIDTAGAELSREAEEGGLAGEIARCVADLLELPSPTVCVLLGQGAGGAALALLPADRVVAAEHGWLSPLPPEGAAAILYRDTGQADRVAAEQGISSADLLASGVVDLVVPERPDAAVEPSAFLHRLGRVLAGELLELLRRDPAGRLAGRSARYRRLGR
ncbi:MAG: acetyl-CoA carboxyl transferase [Actinobacteria bacterium]|nr:acetyl-CoA carboxyl transferase [Actinomycetota bacterium]MBI3687829.1 acetyl-CoA carboxyl transferase [Actinomycetota bacterium]